MVAKLVLCYVKGTRNLGMIYETNNSLQLLGYSDSD